MLFFIRCTRLHLLMFYRKKETISTFLLLSFVVQKMASCFLSSTWNNHFLKKSHDWFDFCFDFVLFLFWMEDSCRHRFDQHIGQRKRSFSVNVVIVQDRKMATPYHNQVSLEEIYWEKSKDVAVWHHRMMAGSDFPGRPESRLRAHSVSPQHQQHPR